ncbi:MAG: LptF/LptG family permease [Ignavibacterium sp.]|nr:LptF/LptG family permease [Ignavibacterium sp.]MCX7610188.1 LptF/LptG family permease [Ignavibacterium sp.]MDW8374869.1 LptF/LptG family permease [Ignavibacteriales bacterium]
MILYRYILKNHLIPFVFSIFTLTGVFLLQFLMRFADRLVGKGLDAWVIIKLIAYNLSWMFVLVVPMSSLVSTLMAFGNLSQNNEITIMKSSGISLYKMMLSPVIASIIVAYLLFLFNNEVLPDANHQAKVLMSDISRTKPTLSLEPGFFSQEVSNYAILARRIDQNTNELFDLTIYDYSNLYKINVVTAKRGKIFFSANQTKLIMSLEDGEIHESDVNNTSIYRRLKFERHKIAMNAEQFSFQQTGGYSRGERELSIQAMNYITDSLKNSKDLYQKQLVENSYSYLLLNNNIPFHVREVYIKDPKNDKIVILERLNTAKSIITSSVRQIEFTQREINNYEVEIHKKYALPVACLIFILIGAPLGVMVRKGGFGVAAGISLFFFLIYWAFLIGGEKLSDRGIISPFWGMWAGNVFFGVIGLILIIRTNLEVKTISFDFLKKIIPKSLSFKSENDENQNY